MPTIIHRTEMTTITRGELIAWESQTGLPNRGRAVFTPDAADSSATNVSLIIEFNVPGFVSALFDSAFVTRFVDNTLLADLKRFRSVALLKKRQRVADGQAVPDKAADVVELAMVRLAQQ